MQKYIFIILVIGTADCLPAPEPRKILDPSLYLIPHPPLIATSEEKQQENTWIIPLVSASSIKSGNSNEADIPTISSSGSEPMKEVEIQSPHGTNIMFQGMKVQAFLKPYQVSSVVNEISYQKVPENPINVQKEEDKKMTEIENVGKKIEEKNNKKTNEDFHSEQPSKTSGIIVEEKVPTPEELKTSGITVEEIVPTPEELKTAETFWSSPNYGYAGSNYGRYASGYLGYGNAYGGYSSRPAWTGGWGNGKWGHYGSG